MGWNELFTVGARYGVVTYEDARRCGVSTSSLDTRAAREVWPARPYPGVIVLPGRQLDDRGRIYAALRSVRAAVAVGGAAALHLHGLLDAPPQQTDLWVPLRHRGVSTADRRIRRSKILRPSDLLLVDGLPTVRPAWAVRDVAGSHDLDQLRNFLIDGRFRRQIELDEVRDVLRRDTRAPGRAKLVRAVDELADDGSDSGFEFRTRGRVEDEGYRPDPGQLELWTPGGTRRLDLPFEKYKAGVECHGFRYHGDRARFDADAERWNDVATLDGWVILHLTWSMQYGAAWHRFLARLDAVLTSRGYQRG